MAMFSKVLSYDPITDTTEVFHHDPNTNEMWVESRQGSARRRGALDSIADVTKEMYANHDGERFTDEGPGTLVAKIPMVFFEQHPELMHDNKALKKWLNNPDNKLFRTRPGRI